MNDKFVFRVKKRRPEEIYDQVIDYYKNERLIQYASSKNIMRIQERITRRALEILELEDKNRLILDVGSGPGFSTFYLKHMGFKVIALDIILKFLDFYNNKDINPILADMCFLPFKPNSFDAIISISALQWIIKDLNEINRVLKIRSLAKNFYHILKYGSKIVFQFYPKDDIILKEIGKIFANSTKFNGYFIIDNPKIPKKRKIFLVLKK